MAAKNIIRIITSTIIGSIIMLTLSYSWHAIILNDFSSLQYNPNIYLWLLFILYLFISLSLTFIVSFYNPFSKRLIKHALIGVFIGFLVYLIAFVLGVSFNKGGLEHIILDFIWQMIEQGVGITFISIFYSLSYRYDKLKKMNSFE